MFITKCSPLLFFNQAFHAQPRSSLSALYALGLWHEIADHEGSRARGRGCAFSRFERPDKCLRGSSEIVDMGQFEAGREDCAKLSQSR